MPGEPRQRPASRPGPPAAAISPWVIAAVSGAVAASLVIVVPGSGMACGPPLRAGPFPNAAAIDDLAARIASIESRTSKPPAAAPDPAAAARVEALEKSLASLRCELAVRARNRKLASEVDDVKTAPRDIRPSADLPAINGRIAQVGRAVRVRAGKAWRRRAKPSRRSSAAPYRGGSLARRSGSDRRSLSGR